MDTVAIGDLVSVAGAGAPRDGIVYDTPSPSKVVVAMVDPRRGPGFRPVHPKTLTAREKEGSHDPALRLLIRRTPAPGYAGAPGGGTGRTGRAGFPPGATQRPTGK